MSRKVASILQINLIILSLPVVWLGFTYINQVSGEPWSTIRIFTIFFVIVGVIIFSDIISSIFHETGHLIGGLLTGYTFVYYGLFGKIWLKIEDKLTRKRNNQKGLGGVSQLSPPDMKEGSFPFRLYYFSGSLMNLILAGICATLFFLIAPFLPTWSIVFLILGLKATTDFIMNILPVNNNGNWNDGYILFNFGKEKNADIRLKYWRNFRIQGFFIGGTRPKDIPETYYKWANINKKIDDFFVVEAGFLKYKVLMDKRLFDDAHKCMKAISLHLEPSMAGYQPAINLELIFHELIGECREKEIRKLYTKEVEKYTQENASNESIQRVSYAYFRLLMKDEEKAQIHLDLFNKAIANSINIGNIPSEKELIQLVDNIAHKRG